MRFFHRTKRRLIGIFILLLSTPAFATLGGLAASVNTDMMNLHARVTKSNLPQLTSQVNVIQFETEKKVNVREYLSKIGKVFGVCWNGPVMPESQQLLGSYYDIMLAEAKKRLSAPPNKRTDHNHFFIDRPDLVMASVGHMHSITGCAYLPQEMPSKVMRSDLK